MANALTAIRFLLILPVGLLLVSTDSRAALVTAFVLVVAIVTDLLDGPLARRMGTATPLGGTFDHTTDFLYVVSGMTGGVMRGVIPGILPVLVVAAFAQYLLDSYWLHRQHGLRGSSLGRYNGVLYFFPLCGDTMIRLGLTFLSPALALLCWLLVASTLASMGQRLIMSVRQLRQRVPVAPSSGISGQSPR